MCVKVGDGDATNAMLPFLSLLEGGEGGDLHNEVIDYFYYAQLRTQVCLSGAGRYGVARRCLCVCVCVCSFVRNAGRVT